METITKIAEVKKVYTIFSDEETRGFCASLRRLQKDCEDAEAQRSAEDASAAVKSAEDALKAAKKAEADKKREAAKKSSEEAQKKAEAAAQAVSAAESAVNEAQKIAAAAQQKAAEAKKRSASSEKAARALASLADVMQRKNLRAADINKDYLLQNLPLRFNAAQQICSVKLVKLEDEAETRKNFADAANMLVERENRLFIYKPILLFTANTFLSLFCSAADAKRKAEAEASSAAEKEAKKREAAEKEAKRIEAMRAKIAAYEAKQQKASAADAK